MVVFPEILRESLARLVCRAEGVDPDAEGLGCGVLMPKGEVYPLWKARLRVVDELVAAYEVLPRR